MGFGFGLGLGLGFGLGATPTPIPNRTPNGSTLTASPHLSRLLLACFRLEGGGELRSERAELRLERRPGEG